MGDWTVCCEVSWDVACTCPVTSDRWRCGGHRLVSSQPVDKEQNKYMQMLTTWFPVKIQVLQTITKKKKSAVK